MSNKTMIRSGVLRCKKCGELFREIGGRLHSDGDSAQWCPYCGASDDFIDELTDKKSAGLVIRAPQIPVGVSPGEKAAELLERDALLSYPDHQNGKRRAANIIDQVYIHARSTASAVGVSKDEEWTVLEEGLGRITIVQGDSWVAMCSTRLYAEQLCSAHNASLADLRKKLDEAESMLAAHDAIMELPEDYCVACGGEGGHEEGCKGITGLMALNRQLSAHRVTVASQARVNRSVSEMVPDAHLWRTTASRRGTTGGIGRTARSLLTRKMKESFDYSEWMALRRELSEVKADRARQRKRADRVENVLFAIANERPVQDKAASAFYRVRQKAKHALSSPDTLQTKAT